MKVTYNPETPSFVTLIAEVQEEVQQFGTAQLVLDFTPTLNNNPKCIELLDNVVCDDDWNAWGGGFITRLTSNVILLLQQATRNGVGCAVLYLDGKAHLLAEYGSPHTTQPSEPWSAQYVAWEANDK